MSTTCKRCNKPLTTAAPICDDCANELYLNETVSSVPEQKKACAILLAQVYYDSNFMEEEWSVQLPWTKPYHQAYLNLTDQYDQLMSLPNLEELLKKMLELLSQIAVLPEHEQTLAVQLLGNALRARGKPLS